MVGWMGGVIQKYTITSNYIMQIIYKFSIDEILLYKQQIL